MYIFVTGATGVIGRRIVPMLVEAGHQVTALGRTPEKRDRLERQGATPVSVDLFDPNAVRRAVAGQDVIINLATHIPRSSVRMFLPWAWRENDRLRRDASAILADAAIAEGAARFIQESFAPIYQDGGAAWIDEDAPVQPARHNRSALDAEHAADRFTQRGGTGVALRFAYFYGPDAAPVPDMIASLRKGWAPLPGTAAAFYSSISHDDAASAVVAALHVPAGIYNVTDDEPMPRRAYFDALAEILGAEPPRLLPSWLARLGGPLGRALARSHRISNEKFRAEAAWSPRYPSAREGWQALVRTLEETDHTFLRA